MAMTRAGKLYFDPAKNPAILDTTTWDPEAAIRAVRAFGAAGWESLRSCTASGDVARDGYVLFSGSRASMHGDPLFLASLPDGQDVFLHFGRAKGKSALGRPLGALDLSDGRSIHVFKVDMATLSTYVRDINPGKGPVALGRVPRLGIGNRHTTAMWPGIFRAMDEKGFAANAIQNSLRELNLLSELKEGAPAHENYLFGFGSIAEGHTGSTFEGLLHAGTIAAVKHPAALRYGADADHVSVKRGPGGLARAKQVLRAARYFSFFTLDMSDILDYDALKVASPSQANEKFESVIADAVLRRDLLDYYGRPRKTAGMQLALADAEIAGFVAKYWKAFDALEALCAYLRELKGGEATDIELSVDENPPEYPTCECVTSPRELLFVATEIHRRHLPVTHLAPNFGVQKGTDYNCSDGLEGLEKRVGLLTAIAAEHNLMTDCHSGDDLSRATRRVIGRASRGAINFKISPYQQLLFAETLCEAQPELFRYWWDDVIGIVEQEARKGSAFAIECMSELASDPSPSPSKKAFHYYCFISVGRRDARGQFVNREQLYGLSDRFRAEFDGRMSKWIGEVAEDIYSQ